MTDRFTPGHRESAAAHLNDEALADLAQSAIMNQATTTDQTAVTHQTTTTADAPAADPWAADPWAAGPSDAQAKHLASCANCRRALEHTIRVLTALHAPVEIFQPPEELWDRIATEIQDTGDDHQVDDDRVAVLRPRESRSWRVPLAAAASGALIGGAAVAAVMMSQDDAPETDPSTTATVIGEATLEPIAADEFTGNAEMVQTAEGTLELTVEITTAPDEEDGYFELWLRDEEASRLFSLGAVTPGSTTFDVPAGVDLSDYPVVDVSHEHFDGDPGHGGVTLAAGPMERED